MIAADTNLLVRILVDDPGQPDQVRIARKIASESKQLFIPQIVQVELVWVLQAACKLEKAVIIDVLEHLLHNTAFMLQAEDRFMEALELFKTASCGFSDCLISAESRAASCTLVTFDKKLSRQPGVQLAEK